MIALFDFWPIGMESGPDFLSFYFWLGIGGLGVGILAAWQVGTRDDDAAVASAWRRQVPLRVGWVPRGEAFWAISYLRGRDDDLARTLVCSALAEGALAPAESAGKFLVGTTPGKDPLVEELRGLLGGKTTKVRNGATVVEAAERVARRHARSLTATLVDAGLQRSEGAIHRRRLAVWLPGGLVLLVGLLRLIRGISLDRPVTLLVLELMGVAVGILFLTLRVGETRARGGESYLEWLSGATTSLRSDVESGRRSAPHEIALAAAAGGAWALMAVPRFSPVKDFLFPPPPVYTGGSSDGSSSDDSSSSCSSSSGSSSSCSSSSSSCGSGGGCGSGSGGGGGCGG